MIDRRIFVVFFLKSTHQKTPEKNMFTDPKIEILVNTNSQRPNVSRVPIIQRTFRHVRDLNEGTDYFINEKQKKQSNN